MDEFLTVGRLARASGLTPKAIRHYDAVGLLRPAAVDPHTGYRYYSPAQVDVAQRIRELRDLDVSLDDIRAVLTAADPAAEAAVLDTHRARVEAQLWRLQRIIHSLTNTTEEHMTATASTDDERRLAADLFNTVWRFLEDGDRSSDDAELMVHAAHASAYFWRRVGNQVNRARAEWQLSRVYATVGRAEPALVHARRCRDVCRDAGLGGFDLGCAHEALARASLVAGDESTARRHAATAREIANGLADEDERELLLTDIGSLDLPAPTSTT